MSVEPFTLGIGRMINKMGMVSKPGQTIPNMMDTIKKAKKSGNGTYLWLDGSKYSGHWKFNQITGFGVKKTYLNIYELSSNNHFTSEMNFFEFQGVHTWCDGRRFEGNWLENNMHSWGIYTWKDCRRYEVEYKFDKKHGYGVYTWGDGIKKYEGSWKF